MLREEKFRMGLRLKDIRIQRGVSIDMLAIRTGVSPTHIRNVERGVKSISLDALVSIAQTLDASLDYIVLGIRNERQMRGLYLHSDEDLLLAHLLSDR